MSLTPAEHNLVLNNTSKTKALTIHSKYGDGTHQIYISSATAAKAATDPPTATVRRGEALLGVGGEAGASAGVWPMEGLGAGVGRVGVGATGGAGGDSVGEAVGAETGGEES